MSYFALLERICNFCQNFFEGFEWFSNLFPVLETLESKLNNDYLALKSAILDAPYVKIFPEICQKSAISEFDCPHNSDQNWRKNSIVVSFD